MNTIRNTIKNIGRTVAEEKFSFLYVLFGVLLATGIASVSAQWTNPPYPAPDNNTAAPLNIGDDSQTKQGPLTINAGSSEAPIGLTVFGKVKINGGEPAVGKVLKAVDANGTAEWGSGGSAVVDSGVITCNGGNITNCSPVSVSFNESFATAPKVIISPVNYTYSNGCRDDAFIMDLGVTSVTTNGFTASVNATQGGCGGDGLQLFELAWIAVGN